MCALAISKCLARAVQGWFQRCLGQAEHPGGRGARKEPGLGICRRGYLQLHEADPCNSTLLRAGGQVWCYQFLSWRYASDFDWIRQVQGWPSQALWLRDALDLCKLVVSSCLGRWDGSTHVKKEVVAGRAAHRNFAKRTFSRLDCEKWMLCIAKAPVRTPTRCCWQKTHQPTAGHCRLQQRQPSSARAVSSL